MRVLMLSGDPNVLDPHKEAYERMRWYREVLGELEILVPQGNFLVRLWGLYFEGARLCRQKRFDIITAQASDELGFIAYLISRQFGIPLQLQIHTDIFSPWYRRASWKEYARYLLAKFLIPRAACLRVVSERIRDSLLQATDYKLQAISVLPIFTDVSKFLNAAPDPAIEARFRDYDFKMIAVGRFVDKEKNFSMLIEVMRDFVHPVRDKPPQGGCRRSEGGRISNGVKICPNAVLVLVGEGPDRKKYEARIKNQGLEKHVILEKWRDDLPSFYKSFDLYLLSSNYEGWGRTVIEAMAAGLPVVMTDVGLAGEVVKNEINGLVVPVADKRSFLEAVVNLYKNPEKRGHFSKVGREIVGSMGPETKGKYLALYKESFQKCVF